MLTDYCRFIFKITRSLLLNLGVVEIRRAVKHDCRVFTAPDGFGTVFFFCSVYWVSYAFKSLLLGVKGLIIAVVS